MNQETLAALSPVYGLFDAKTIETVNRIRPLDGLVTPETALCMAALRQHAKVPKLIPPVRR